MSKLTPVGEVKTVANPQKELVKLSNENLTKIKDFEADKFAELIMQCLTFVSDESKIKLFITSPENEKVELDKTEVGLSKLRTIINNYTAPKEGLWKFTFKSDKVEATYHFREGKFSNKLDKLIKNAISYGVRDNEFKRVSDKGSNVFASDDYLGIMDIFKHYKDNFAPNASLANILPLFIAVDSLNKKQFAQVYCELSKQLNDQMSFNALIEKNDNTNQITFTDED